MFRKAAKDQLETPDQLDRMLMVHGRRSWLPLTIFGTMILLALGWSVVARVPVKVLGYGALVSPGNVRPLQAKMSGMLLELKVRPGHRVEAGQVIAVVYQPELEQQLQQARSEREKLSTMTDRALKLERGRAAMELKALKRRRDFVEQELQRMARVARKMKRQVRRYARAQRHQIQQNRALSSDLNETITERHQAVESLREDGLASQQMLLETESSLVSSQLNLASIDVQLQQLGLKELEAQQTYLSTQNRVADLEQQLMQMEIDEQKLQSHLDQASFELTSRLDRARDSEQMLGLNLDERKFIRSAYSGIVIELSVMQGQVVEAGTVLGKIDCRSLGSSLKSLAYFPVREGKRISADMGALISPSTVERERHGSIRGRVTKVSSYPISHEAAARVVGSIELARAFTGGDLVIEVETELGANPETVSGYEWTSRGPALQMTAGTTATTWVTIDERAPITYLFPFLARWLSTGDRTSLPTDRLSVWVGSD